MTQNNYIRRNVLQLQKQQQYKKNKCNNRNMLPKATTNTSVANVLQIQNSCKVKNTENKCNKKCCIEHNTTEVNTAKYDQSLKEYVHFYIYSTFCQSMRKNRQIPAPDPSIWSCGIKKKMLFSRALTQSGVKRRHKKLYILFTI